MNDTVLFDGRWSGQHGIGRFADELGKGIAHQSFPALGRPMSAFDPVRLSLTIRKAARDSVFFSPGYNAPLWGRNPFIITVHDLNHIDRPENSSAAKRLYYATVLMRACQRAAAVLTVSEFSRQQILKWARLPATKVVNVGNGVGYPFAPHGEIYAPGFPYVLCVGNRKAHKNERRVVDAFCQTNLPKDVRLLFTGPSSHELKRQAALLGAHDRVHFLGILDETTLSQVYRGALCLAFPSLYEGFGLPVMEAFACGTPVVTSSTSSLAEVAADAALTVDPCSVVSISTAIHRIATDGPLRGVLRERGLARAASYSWSKVVGRVLSVIERVEEERRAETIATTHYRRS